MKKFKFTLEAVRTVRQRQENETQELYARALLARQQAMAALEAHDQELQRAGANLVQMLNQGCSASDADQAQRFHRALEARRVDCLNVLNAAERRVSATMQSMIAARQQREMVDVYREKQEARHERLVANEEQKLLDELAARRLTSFATAFAHE